MIKLNTQEASQYVLKVKNFMIIFGNNRDVDYTNTSWLKENCTERFFFSLAELPNLGQGHLILELSRSHTVTHHSLWDSPGRGIGPSHRPQLENTQHLQATNFYAPPPSRRHSNSQSQQAIGRRPSPLTARPLVKRWNLIVAICTTSFNIYKFCFPLKRCIYVFCVGLRTKVIIFLYSIDWLVFLTEAVCVFCAVRTASVYNSG
jgi:hypothetical protein